MFTVLATGFTVSKTSKLVELAQQEKEKRNGHTAQHGCYVDVSVPEVHILSLSKDELTLAVCHGECIVDFYDVPNFVHKVTFPISNKPNHQLSYEQNMEIFSSSEKTSDTVLLYVLYNGKISQFVGWEAGRSSKMGRLSILCADKMVFGKCSWTKVLTNRGISRKPISRI